MAKNTITTRLGQTMRRNNKVPDYKLAVEDLCNLFF